MEDNSAAAGGINGELPVELLWQILLKLPVKSLCRFRCVSKLCCSVISDPLFVEARARAYSGDRPELLIAFHWQSTRSRDVFHLFQPKQTTIRSVTELYSTPYPSQRSADRTVQTLAPSCRSILVQRPMSHQVGGLYCLDLGYSVRICNPSTREFFDLGTVFNPFLMKRTESDAPGVRITNHFGFDPIERKHKVISIWNQPYFECYVFVLEDNYWTKILDNYPREFNAPGIHNVVCVDGVVFSAPYIGSRRDDKQILVAFDVRTETFRVIQQLPGPRCRWRPERSLIEFGGRVAILSRNGLNHRNESPRITLWVLEDLEQQVWRRKDCVIPLGEEHRNSEGLIIQGGTPEGELILAPTSFKDQFFLLIYNVESNAIRRIELRGIPRGPPSRSVKFVRFHVESLQSPKPKHPV